MGYNKRAYALGSNRSVIREIFEYAKMQSERIGAENVFDFSIGNPSLPVPQKVSDTLMHLIENRDSASLHGYTSAQGDFSVRSVIADDIKNRFGVSDITPNHIYMTCGASSSLIISLGAIVEEGVCDECIVFAPFFTEYRVFIETAGGRVVASMPDDGTFQIDIDDFEKRITPRTKAVIINSPNNPSGVVYTEEKIKAVCDILREKSAEYGHDIFIIADEPYRELVYSDVQVPYLMNYYDNTIVCYSYSKTLSLPGERIGYIAVCPKARDGENLYFAICGAGRAYGYICAPSLFQYVIAECANVLVDVDRYKENRDVLYRALTDFGFECVYPDGAFYLFVKAPSGDAYEFYETAKKFEILVVPTDDFGVSGYVRIAYCTEKDKILRSLPSFGRLADIYFKKEK